jgi:hypothetical protein
VELKVGAAAACWKRGEVVWVLPRGGRRAFCHVLATGAVEERERLMCRSFWCTGRSHRLHVRLPILNEDLSASDPGSEERCRV